MIRTGLQSQLGVEATPRTESRFPKDGGFYVVTVGCDLTVADEANLPAAIAKLEAAMTAPTKQQAEDWLILLKAATAGGRKSEAESAIGLDLFSGVLSRYPADVARKTCEILGTQARDSTAWFPTLPEIVALADRLVSGRAAMLGALRNRQRVPIPEPQAYDPPKPKVQPMSVEIKPEPRPRDPAEKAAMVAKLREMAEKEDERKAADA